MPYLFPQITLQISLATEDQRYSFQIWLEHWYFQTLIFDLVPWKDLWPFEDKLQKEIDQEKFSHYIMLFKIYFKCCSKNVWITNDKDKIIRSSWFYFPCISVAHLFQWRKKLIFLSFQKYWEKWTSKIMTERRKISEFIINYRNRRKIAALNDEVRFTFRCFIKTGNELLWINKYKKVKYFGENICWDSLVWKDTQLIAFLISSQCFYFIRYLNSFILILVVYPFFELEEIV